MVYPQKGIVVSNKKGTSYRHMLPHGCTSKMLFSPKKKKKKKKKKKRKSQTQRLYTVLFHLYEIFRKDKAIQTESRLVVTWSRSEEEPD